jgi:adenylosuccinate synthase
VGDTGREVREAYNAGKRVMFEGAQGLLLDIDHGTYPYVTSSNTGVGGISNGVGFPPRSIESALGIAKAYCTRVGEGPFPTELFGDEGDALRKAGKEFGTTTGRPRRAGWFDAVAVRYALELGGADGWVCTKLDVLSGLDELRVGVAYNLDGERHDHWPAHLWGIEGVEPEYKSYPGWTEDISSVRSFDELPITAQEYIHALEGLVGVRVRMISVGPERDAIIDRGAM